MTITGFFLLLAVASALSFGGAGFLLKVGVERKYPIQQLLLGLYLSGTLLFACIVSVNNQWDFSFNYLIAGIVIALGSSFGNLFVGRALGAGPASLTSPLVNMNVVLVAIMSVLFYGERLNLLSIIGLVFLITAMVFIKYDPNEDMKIKNNLWYLYLILAIGFIFSREAGLKITLEAGLNNNMVLVLGYLFAGLGLFIYSFKTSKISATKNMPIRIFKSPGFYLGLIMGIFSFLGLFLYAQSLRLGPASIAAPLFSLRSVVIIGLSMLLYKERISKYQLYALTLICISLSLLSIK